MPSKLLGRSYFKEECFIVSCCVSIFGQALVTHLVVEILPFATNNVTSNKLQGFHQYVSE